VIELDQLIALALGDHPDPDPIDEHVLACGQCARTLERILLLGDGVHELVGAGQVRFAMGADTYAQLQASGLIARTYRIPAGGSVACSVGPTDVYQSAELAANLAGVTRLDVIKHLPHGQVRLADIPFDPEHGVVRTVERGDFLRTLPSVQLVFELVAVEEGVDRSVGKYYFNHSASSPR
jgi:hypothetical protein